MAGRYFQVPYGCLVPRMCAMPDTDLQSVCLHPRGGGKLTLFGEGWVRPEVLLARRLLSCWLGEYLQAWICPESALMAV